MFDFSPAAENRLLRVCKSLNLNTRERAVYTSLLLDTRPWPVQTLADWTGYSRAAIRQNLHDLRLMGWAEPTASGWLLTARGRASIERLRSEVIAVAGGHQKALSGALLADLAAVNRPGLLRRWRIPLGAVLSMALSVYWHSFTTAEVAVPYVSV